MSQFTPSAHEATISQLKYLIGWICIHPSEYYEAVKMFDEIHDSTRLIRGRDDNNSYDIGRMGDHLVVMNCPASCIYGQSRAAIIASDMRSTFPGIRFMLLVGTSGGVPSSKQDVRLGDVVLGTQVIPYQKRELFDDGHEIISRIATPPAILQSAMTRLESKLRRGLALHETIENIESPSLSRPTQDRLYSAGYTHCPSHCDCLSAKVRALGSICPRKSRNRGDSVKVHQGAVGSADSAMKDASRRDEYARLLGILCYETEAHAIMETVSCLTVCGISDYCDGHECDGWHAYASLAAAVCTKELLYTITDVGSRCPLEVTPGELERWVQGTREEVYRSFRQATDSHDEYQTMDRNIDIIIERYGLVQEAISSKLYPLRSQVDPEIARQLSDSVVAMKRLQKELQKCVDALRGRVDKQVERQPRGSEMYELWKLLRNRIDGWMRREKEVAKATHKILGNGRIGRFPDAVHKVQHANQQTSESRKQLRGTKTKSWFWSSGDKQEQEKQTNGSPAPTPSTVLVTCPSPEQGDQIHHPEQPYHPGVSEPPYLSLIPSLYGAVSWESAEPALTPGPGTGPEGSQPQSLPVVPERPPPPPPRPSSTDEDPAPPLPPRPILTFIRDDALTPAIPAPARPAPPKPPKLPAFEPSIPPPSPPASCRGSRASAESFRGSTTRQDKHSPSEPVEQKATPLSTSQSPSPPRDSSGLFPATASSPPLEQTIEPPSTRPMSFVEEKFNCFSAVVSTSLPERTTSPSTALEPITSSRESSDSSPVTPPLLPREQRTMSLSTSTYTARDLSPSSPPIVSSQPPEQASISASLSAPRQASNSSLTIAPSSTPRPMSSSKEPSNSSPAAAPPSSSEQTSEPRSAPQIMSSIPSESSNPQPSTLSPTPDQSTKPPSTPQPISSPPRQSSEQFQKDMTSSVVIVVSSPEDPEPRTSVSARRKLFEGIPIMGLRRQVNAED